jgi:hypothetical protein
MPFKPTRLRLKLFAKSSTELLRPGKSSLFTQFNFKFKSITIYYIKITMLLFLQNQLVRQVVYIFL